jgi:hypothetical protein
MGLLEVGTVENLFHFFGGLYCVPATPSLLAQKLTHIYSYLTE